MKQGNKVDITLIFNWPLVVFFAITLVIDFVLLLMLNLASKKIIRNTFIEMCVIYLILWIF
jgi:hypothetical protein